MKKILPLLPLFLGILACSTQSLPTQDVSKIVNATLTAIAQDNLQGVAFQPTFTPISIQEEPIATQVLAPRPHYYWPVNLPEGYALDAANSSASDNGFILSFINPSQGDISIWGGESARRYEYCGIDSIPQIVRGFDGCFPQATGGGFSVQWKEGDSPYVVGGLALSRDLALQIAEQLELLDINTWQERLHQTQAENQTSIPPILWKTYRNELYRFTFEYPAIYDEVPYRDSCGLKENDNEIHLGHQIGLQFLDSGGSTLEEYTNSLLQSKGWNVDSQNKETINGLEAVIVQYRFGGVNRFGTFTLVKYSEHIFAFDFSAGSFCDIPESQVSESHVYSHMIESFRFDQ